MVELSQPYDCLIIGGGPAGLTAALYLGRFRRHVLLVDESKSRAALIPTSHNYPGFPQGVSGENFLSNLRQQAAVYDVTLRRGRVSHLQRLSNGDFRAETTHGAINARTVIMATGMVDLEPSLPNLKRIVYSGVVRFCPICDGYEAGGKRVALLGPPERIIPKALFMRTYTKDILLLPTMSAAKIDEARLREMTQANLALPAAIVEILDIGAAGGSAAMTDGSRHDFDIIYPAMGCSVRSDLALALGAACDAQGAVKADREQMSNIEGLYVAGDLTQDIAQISVATGQAAIAATAIHNRLPRNWL